MITDDQHKREMKLKKEYFWVGVKTTLMGLSVLAVTINLIFF